MKFEMRKDKLLDTVDKMFTVATRGLKSEYTMGGRLTIEVMPNEINFTAGNGHLLAQCKMMCKDNTVGTVTVDIARMKKIVHAVGGSDSLDHILTVKVTDQSLSIKSNQSGSSFVKKSEATVPILKEDHPRAIFKADKYKSEYTFSTELFRSGIHSLEKYRSTMRNKMRYQMICLHFLKKRKELRFVCGDGMRFGIYIATDEKYGENAKGALDDKMYLLPVDQASILTEITERTPDDRGGKEVTIQYKDDSTCFVILDNGIKAKITNIPKVQYVEYAKHAFRMDDTKVIVDVQRSVLSDGMSLINACEDPDIASDTFHSAQFKAQDGLLSLSVHEGKFHCDHEAEAKIIPLSENSFQAEYCAQFLTDASVAGEESIIRFHCIDESTVMIVEPMDYQDQPKEGSLPEDKNGAPLLKEKDRRLILFFASTIHGQ